MIFLDVFKHLSKDVVLKDYLKPTVSDGKIYPATARILNKAPFIVYKSAGVNNGEIIDEESISFQVTAEEYFVMNSIAARLCDIFETEAIPSDFFNIYFSKKINSQDSIDDLGRHARTLVFAFKFRKK